MLALSEAPMPDEKRLLVQLERTLRALLFAI